MSDYLKESRLEVGNHIYYPTSYTTHSQTQAGRGLLDSLDEIKSQEKEAKGIVKSVADARPKLPAPAQSGDPGDLMILAEAFVKAFSAMNKGIQEQTSDYVKLQQLDQTQTQAVLDSTRNTMKKEKAAIQLAAEVTAYEKKMQNEQEIFGWVMMGIGAALMVAVFASAFFDGGASLALEPELAEATIDVATEEAPSLIDDVEMSSDGELASSDLDVSDGVGSDAEMSESSETSEMDSGTRTAEKTMTKELNESNSANGKSAAQWARRIAKFAGKLGVKAGFSAGFASPMLMKAIVSFKVSDKLDDVAKAQKLLGGALATLQQNNMYFQFLQQLTQREGGVLQEEVSDASEVVDTFASIASGYRSISYGLANAV